MPYRPPGVSVELNQQEVVSSAVGAGDTLLLVGSSDNFPQQANQTVVLVGAEPVELPDLGVDPDSISAFGPAGELEVGVDLTVTQTTDAMGDVKTTVSKAAVDVEDDALQFTNPGAQESLGEQNIMPGTVKLVRPLPAPPVEYEFGTDYTVDHALGTITHNPDGQIDTDDDLEVSFSHGTVADGPITLEYERQPTDLNYLHQWSTLREGITYYGPAMNGDVVNSKMSLAMQLISQTLAGAAPPRLLTLVVAPDASDQGDPLSVDMSDWQATLEDNASSEAFTHIVALDGDPATVGMINEFVRNLELSHRKYSRAFSGVDNATKLLNYADGVSPIFGLDSERHELVSPEEWVWRNPSTNNLVRLAGYYVAAMLAAREAISGLDETLNRDQILGMERFPSDMTISENNKNMLAASGVTVLENFGAGVRVRHAKTTALRGPISEEPSVTRALDYMRLDLQSAFDNAFIGNDYMVNDDTILVLERQAMQRFRDYLTDGIIANFANVSVVRSDSDPRALDVYATVVPLFPLLNIDFHVTVMG